MKLAIVSGVFISLLIFRGFSILSVFEYHPGKTNNNIYYFLIISTHRGIATTSSK